MSYMHIQNLYQNQDILLFKECYALEKIHGTSAHITYKNTYPPTPPPDETRDSVQLRKVDSARVDKIDFFAGGCKHETFLAIFDKDKLFEGFRQIGQNDITVYGEAYGGKTQGMKDTYGPDLKFVAFEVKIGDLWLNVPSAENIVKVLGLEYVAYKRVPCTLEALDAERDRESIQAERNGMGTGKLREGVVLRPIIEVTTNNGCRIIAKHKSDAFKETHTSRRPDVDPQTLTDADSIAFEWATPMRLSHVMDTVRAVKGREIGISDTGEVIEAMVGDIIREAGTEIVDSRPARKAISSMTAKLYKSYLGDKINED